MRAKVGLHLFRHDALVADQAHVFPTHRALDPFRIHRDHQSGSSSSGSGSRVTCPAASIARTSRPWLSAEAVAAAYSASEA